MTTLAPKPNRCWPPRFSLITLIVAVNVAGVLLWANLRTGWRYADWGERGLIDQLVVYDRHHGYTYHKPVKDHYRTLLFAGTVHGWPAVAYVEEDRKYKYAGLFLDFAVSLCLIFLTGFVTEFLVRKLRKAKRRDG